MLSNIESPSWKLENPCFSYCWGRNLLTNVLPIFTLLDEAMLFKCAAKLYIPSILWVKTNDNNNCQFYDRFWPFFRQLYIYLSQNWGSDSHFGILNRSKIWLVQRLWHKMQIFPFLVFCNFVQKHSFAFFAFFRFVS